MSTNIDSRLKVNIGIVGEGPIGIVTILNLIYYLKKNNITNTQIFWHKKKTDYTRRHTINVNLFVLKEIEKLFEDCKNCNNNNKILKKNNKVNAKNENIYYTSINCFETLLNEKIKQHKSNINIINQTEFKSLDENSISYHHIFFADGFNSTSRKNFIFDSKNPYKALKIDLKTPILVLYTNISNSSNNKELTSTCKFNEKSNNVIYTNEYFKSNKIDLDIDEITALISLIYGIHNKLDLIKNNENINNLSLPNNFLSKYTQSNLWVTGFKNLDTFKDLFNDTKEFIVDNQVNSIILENKNEEYPFITQISNKNITTFDKILYDNIKNNKALVDILLQKYFAFVYTIILNRNDLFLLHSVNPSSDCFGITFNDNVVNDNGENNYNKNNISLNFCKKLNNSNSKTMINATGVSTNNSPICYLIGDSACAYPPGVSLQEGIKDIFILIKLFINKIYMKNKEQEIDNFDLNVNECNKLTTNEFEFKGGYVKNSELNNNAHNITNLVSYLNTLNFNNDNDNDNNIDNDNNNEKNLIKIYNNYLVKRYFKKIFELICDVNFKYSGGFRNSKKLKTVKYGKRKNIKKSKKVYKKT